MAPEDANFMRKQRLDLTPHSVTLRQVAERARVSTATVSRVLNSPAAVRDDRRKRVLKAISELSYVPHGPAQALVSRRTGTIGAIVPTVSICVSPSTSSTTAPAALTPATSSVPRRETKYRSTR